jgi:translation initiation factor IF-3
MDLVLTNTKVRPVICKIYDYESYVFGLFAKDYIKNIGGCIYYYKEM